MNTAANNTAETKQFEALFRKVVRDIRKLAASTDGQWGPMNKAIVRAIDRLYDLGRFVDDPTTHDQIGGLIAARRFAAMESTENLKHARYAEMARLDEEIRIAKWERRLAVGW